jgi:hypothetical protein
MQFFKIRYEKFSPWIWKFVSKEDDCIVERTCSVCGRKWHEQKNENYYDRPFEALLDKSVSKWTDVIGSGEKGFTLVSQRVLEIWDTEGIGKFPAFPVTIIPPYSKKITEPPPIYYRLDYKKIVGCEIDREASGFGSIKECSGCGYSDGIQENRLRDAKILPTVLKEEAWKVQNIFCTKSGNMLCNENVIDCASKYKMTNFRFIPLEIAGSATSFHGVDYMAKNWRAKMIKQIEEFRNNFRSFDYETGLYVK